MFRLKNPLRALFAFLFLAALSSCSDPDQLGLDLQPTSEHPVIGTIDTFDLKAYTIPEDSLVMYGTLKNSLEVPTIFLGQLNDPLNIGVSTAGFAAQVRVGNALGSPLTGAFADQHNADSIVLSLNYKGFVGDTSRNIMHHISIYELNENLSTDSLYYSSRVFQTKPTLIGHVDIAPDFTDSVSLNGVNVIPQLRIALDSAFGSRLLTDFQNGAYTTETFLTYFKGLVAVDNVDGGGCIMTLLSNTTYDKLTLYYKSGSTPSSYEFIIDGNCVRTAFFHHDYKSDFKDTLADNPIAIQSMAGLKTKMRINDLGKLYAHGKVSISSAKLLVSIDGVSDTKFPAHGNLLILGCDSLGHNTTFIDGFESSSYFGGAFDPISQSYTFNIARYLQRTLNNYVDKGLKDYGFYLIAGGSTSNAQRTILKGGSDVKLIVTYTKVNP